MNCKRIFKAISSKPHAKTLRKPAKRPRRFFRDRGTARYGCSGKLDFLKPNYGLAALYTYPIVEGAG